MGPISPVSPIPNFLAMRVFVGRMQQPQAATGSPGMGRDGQRRYIGD
jgi:hypothetical protein